MNIAVDLDGVLFDTENWFRAYGSIFNLKVDGGKQTNKKGFWVEDCFNWDKETMRKYVDECSASIEKNAPLMPFAREVLLALEKHHNLFVITGRGSFHKDEIQVTKERLKREKLKFKKVLFNQKFKVESCIENKIDLIIEDHPKNAIELAKKGIKCLYFRDILEKRLRHKNLVEVRNWGEVAAELIDMGVIRKEDLVVEMK